MSNNVSLAMEEDNFVQPEHAQLVQQLSSSSSGVMEMCPPAAVTVSLKKDAHSNLLSQSPADPSYALCAHNKNEDECITAEYDYCQQAQFHAQSDVDSRMVDDDWKYVKTSSDIKTAHYSRRNPPLSSTAAYYPTECDAVRAPVHVFVAGTTSAKQQPSLSPSSNLSTGRCFFGAVSEHPLVNSSDFQVRESLFRHMSAQKCVSFYKKQFFKSVVNFEEEISVDSFHKYLRSLLHDDYGDSDDIFIAYGLAAFKCALRAHYGIQIIVLHSEHDRHNIGVRDPSKCFLLRLNGFYQLLQPCSGSVVRYPATSRSPSTHICTTCPLPLISLEAVRLPHGEQLIGVQSDRRCHWPHCERRDFKGDSIRLCPQHECFRNWSGMLNMKDFVAFLFLCDETKGTLHFTTLRSLLRKGAGMDLYEVSQKYMVVNSAHQPTTRKANVLVLRRPVQANVSVQILEFGFQIEQMLLHFCDKGTGSAQVLDASLTHRLASSSTSVPTSSISSSSSSSHSSSSLSASASASSFSPCSSFSPHLNRSCSATNLECDEDSDDGDDDGMDEQ